MHHQCPKPRHRHHLYPRLNQLRHRLGHPIQRDRVGSRHQCHCTHRRHRQDQSYRQGHLSQNLPTQRYSGESRQLYQSNHHCHHPDLESHTRYPDHSLMVRMSCPVDRSRTVTQSNPTIRRCHHPSLNCPRSHLRRSLLILTRPAGIGLIRHRLRRCHHHDPCWFQSLLFLGSS